MDEEKKSVDISIRSLDSTVSVAPEQLARHGLRVEEATGYIRWRKDCRDHPRNWSLRRKTYDITLVMLLEFYTTLISTTGASAAEQAEVDYRTNGLILRIAFSLMYQIGQAIGGLIIPPSSDLFGRRKPYITSCLLFSLSCVLVGAVPHISAVFIGRFLSGFASAVPSVVISGTVEDQFNTEQRVWLVLLWNAAATAGLAFGPIYASYISITVGWRWIFYSAGIVTGVMTILLFWIRESRPSKLLTQKIALLQKECPRADLKYHSSDPFPTWKAFVDVVFIRSSRMMVTEPILIIVSSISAISWGVIYLFSESMTGVYRSLHLPQTDASLPFLALVIGVCLDAFPHIWDIRRLRRKRRHNLAIEPEDKIGGFTFGTLALAVGLWWFYATTPPSMPGAHWLLPTAALIPIGFGVNEIAYTLSGYLTDTYTVYAASAFAGLAFVRAMVAGIAPLVGYVVFDGSQTSVPGYVLSAVATLFCAVPFIFFKVGKTFRQRSSYAQYSFEVNQRTQLSEF